MNAGSYGRLIMLQIWAYAVI